MKELFNYLITWSKIRTFAIYNLIAFFLSGLAFLIFDIRLINIFTIYIYILLFVFIFMLYLIVPLIVSIIYWLVKKELFKQTSVYRFILFLSLFIVLTLGIYKLSWHQIWGY